MNRNQAAELLDAYTKYLLKGGYVDDDIWCEESVIDQFMQTKWFKENFPLVLTDSVFYKNCKQQRKNGAKICRNCPFRDHIEAQEKGLVVTTGDLKRIDEAREEKSTINNKDFFDSKLTSKYKRK